MIFTLGVLVTSIAPTLASFLLGRVITGVGASGIFGVSILLVLELTSKKRRGLFIGVLNTGFTLGVSLGAVIAGALASGVGWRSIFYCQAPLALVAGISIFFAIPKPAAKGPAEESLRRQLMRVDYFGMLFLVSRNSPLINHPVNISRSPQSSSSCMVFQQLESSQYL